MARDAALGEPPLPALGRRGDRRVLLGGPVAADGLPGPAVFVRGAAVVLVPRDGFGFVTAGHEVVGPGRSECILGVSVATPAEVDASAERAWAAGGTVAVEPGDPGWGYQATVADPDGHLWLVEVR